MDRKYSFLRSHPLRGTAEGSAVKFDLAPYHWVQSIVAENPDATFSVAVDALNFGASIENVFDFASVFKSHRNTTLEIIAATYNTDAIPPEGLRDNSISAARIRSLVVTFDGEPCAVYATVGYQVDAMFDGREWRYQTRGSKLVEPVVLSTISLQSK